MLSGIDWKLGVSSEPSDNRNLVRLSGLVECVAGGLPLRLIREAVRMVYELLSISQTAAGCRWVPRGLVLRDTGVSRGQSATGTV